MGFDSKVLRGIAATAVISGLMFIVGCGGSSEEGEMAGGGGGGDVVAAGDTVSLNYKGTLEDGSVFDSTGMGQPFEFIAGAGQVIPGFDEAVIGMSLNETKTFTIPDSLAYGPHRADMFRKVPNSFFPEDMTPEVGMQLNLQDNQGRPFPGTISEVGEDSVTLDLNHPLAGEDLTFEIEVVGIK